MNSFVARLLPGIGWLMLLAGCAGVGVPATDDPWKQYLHACALMQVGRVTRAEPLLTQSLIHYEGSDEYLRLAMVEMQYAVLIESPTFVVSRYFAAERAGMGGREALPAKARELNGRAKSNVLKALAAPASPVERTQALVVLVEAHQRLGERREACATIERAAASYGGAQGTHYSYATYGQPDVRAYLQDRREFLECARIE